MIYHQKFTEFSRFYLKKYPACRSAACKKFLQFQLGLSGEAIQVAYNESSDEKFFEKFFEDSLKRLIPFSEQKNI